MRYFRKPQNAVAAGPVYCCQKDAMIGLGCGGRSYTSELHYSDRFAVEAQGVHAILNDWIKRTGTDFSFAHWGCRLSDDDRRRRFLIQSLLMLPGLDASVFARQFEGASAMPVLAKLAEQGFVERRGAYYRLTPLGFEFSDAIGPALYSPQNFAHLESFSKW